MSMIKMTRRLEFDAGHRVVGHQGKCRHLHGHRYVVEVTCTAPALDELGMVIDFGLIKSYLGGWLDGAWDHGMILWAEDPLASIWHTLPDVHKMFRLPYNPTAENLAKYLAEVVWPQLGMTEADDLQLVSIRVGETPNCWAEWVRE